jgi:SAM-dependent methyltransferase
MNMPVPAEAAPPAAPASDHAGPSGARKAAPSTYHRLVALKYRLPEWLRYRLDPYNTAADRFIAASAARVSAGARVLDAGAGECRHAQLFRHARYVGTDNGAGDVAAYDYARVSFLSDLTRLPVRTGRFEAVISVNVLEHTAEPARVLAECRRALGPGGRLYLVAPQSWQLHQAPQDFLRFTRYGLDHLLRQAGFVPVEITPLGGAFWNLGLRSLYFLTHVPRALVPLTLLLAPIFGFLVPFLCFYLDKLDRRKEDTLGHAVVACTGETPPPLEPSGLGRAG